MADASGLGDVRLVVFDWDGTLMDSTGRIVACLRATSRELGLPERRDVEYRGIIGLGVYPAAQRLYPDEIAAAGGDDSDLVQHYASAYRRIYLHEDTTPAPMYPGALELLGRLAALPHVLLAVATGKSRAGLDQALASAGVGDVFFATATTCEHPSKPSPAMLEWLLERAGVEPSAARMIGDSSFDIEMARAVGVTAWGVGHGAQPPVRLYAAGAEAVFDDLPALESTLMGWCMAT